MTKTLADMTSEERADCVGMWALIEGTNLAVIAEADATNACVVVYPQWDGDSAVHFNGMVTPRYDSPRAWAPDGEPVGTVVDAEVEPLRVNGMVNPHV